MNIKPEINTRDKTVLTIIPKFDVYPRRFFSSGEICQEMAVLPNGVCSSTLP